MRNAIIFLDSGNTLVDESTEVRIKGDVVDHAEFFTGIKEVLFRLKNAGFRVALVADGLVESFAEHSYFSSTRWRLISRCAQSLRL